MPSPLPQDLRDRVLAAYDRGLQTKEIAANFAVSPAWARRVNQVRREEGRTTPLSMGGVRVVKIDLEQLRKLVQEKPDATIPELHQRLGLDTCCESAVGRALIRLGLTFKKRRFTPPNRIGRMSPRNARNGPAGSRRVRQDDSSSSMKRGPKPT
jgi:transposase